MGFFKKTKYYVLNIKTKQDITPVQVAESIKPLTEIWAADKWSGITKKVIVYAMKHLDGYEITYTEKK